MVPLGTVAKVEEISGPQVLTRYNMYPAAAITGSVAPGYSTGQGIAIVEELARRELPDSMAFEWSENTFLERQSAHTGMIVFGLSVVFVFLVLAALCERLTPASLFVSSRATATRSCVPSSRRTDAGSSPAARTKPRASGTSSRQKVC